MSFTNRLKFGEEDFSEKLDALLAWESVSDRSVAAAVDDIIARIRTEGDTALVELTNKFDRRRVESAGELELSKHLLRAAYDRLPGETAEAIKTAAARIESFHQRQSAESWRYEEDDGTQLGQKVTPLDRVGLYVPGGKAAYPSSVLMNAVPARVAGVGELVICLLYTSPSPRDGLLSRMPSSA